MKAPAFKNLQDVKDASREFGLEVMRPAGIALDKLHDPQSVIEKGSMLWQTIQKTREAGFHLIDIPKSFGGISESVPGGAHNAMMESFGYADPGLAISFVASGAPFKIALASPYKEVREWAHEYAADTKGELVGCWGITEPNHGSDWVIGTTRDGGDPKLTPTLRAEKHGDYYILNGQKSAWVSNGSIATHSALHVLIDGSRGMHGTGVALCPLDLPGISRGPALNKLGQRALNQGEIFFSEVKLHKKYMFISKPGFLASDLIGPMFIGTANHETGTIFSGHSRAIYDETLKFVRNNSRNGDVLFEQKKTKIQLFKMFATTESASALAEKTHTYYGGYSGKRSLIKSTFSPPKIAFNLVGKIASYIANNPEKAMNFAPIKKYRQGLESRPEAHPGSWGIACKTFCTEASHELACEALKIFGQDALTKKYPIEKMYRDARASLIEDGNNDVLSLAGAMRL